MATAQLLLRDPGFDQTLFGSTSVPTPDPSELETQLNLLSVDRVVEGAANRLGRISADQVRSSVDFTAEPDTNLLTVAATTEDPERSARMANALASEYIAFRRNADRNQVINAQNALHREIEELRLQNPDDPQIGELESHLQDLGVLASLQTGNVELVESATPPSSASYPQPRRNLFIAAFAGLLLALALALVREQLDQRIKSPDDLGYAFDLPVLGVIPIAPNAGAAHGSLNDLPPNFGEGFRMLATNLRFFDVENRVDSVVVTSSSPGEGKTTVALHLAVAAAAAGGRVLLIDADLRRPTLAERLELPESPGLSQVLAGIAEPSTVQHEVPVTSAAGGEEPLRMTVIPGGSIPPNPTNLLASERMRDLLAAARDDYDLVVVDTSPAGVVADPLALVHNARGVILVAHLGTITQEGVQRIRRQLDNVGVEALGVVANFESPKTVGGSYYGYGYDVSPADPRQNGSTEEPVSASSSR